MNVICNTCIGGWIYKKNKIQFNNPFIWNGIDVIPMLNLINHYDELKYTKDIELDKDKTTNNKSFIIKLPYNIIIHYTHYKLDFNVNTNYIKGVDVFGPKIYEYTYNKFIERKQRWMDNKEEPTFIVVTRQSDIYNFTLDNSIKFIENLKTNYKIIVLTNFKHLLKYNTKKINVLCVEEDLNGTMGPAEFVDKYLLKMF